MANTDLVDEATKAAFAELGIISPPKQAGATALLSYLRHGNLDGKRRTLDERVAYIKRLQATFQGKRVKYAHGSNLETGECLYVTAQAAGRPIYTADDGLHVHQSYGIKLVASWSGGASMHGPNVLAPLA